MTRATIVNVLAALMALTACTSETDNKETSKEQSAVETVPVIKGVTSVGDGNNHLPHLLTDTTGQVYLSYVESRGDTSMLKYRRLNEGMQWSDAAVVATGDNWFVNWADYPMISTFAGTHFLAHYLAKNGEGTFHYEVTMQTSADSGEHWNDPFVLHDDGKQAEHGFVSMVPYGNNFFVSWLDGRNAGEHHGEHTGAMNLRGAIVSPAGEKLEEWLLDDRVCDCCQTAAAMTDQGPVVVYRNRSEGEVRDMYITRYENGQWSEPAAIYNDDWEIHGCPVNGPRISSDGERMVIAWFTGSPEPRVQAIFSEDGGKTFGDPLRIDEHSPIGRVDVELVEDGAVVSWMEGSALMAARISHTALIERYLITNSSSSRSSGFPQMELMGDTLIFAWTDSDASNVKTGWVAL